MSRRQVLGLVTMALLGGCDCNAEVTVYLVRHAEKAKDGSDDPPLSDLGAKRAAALADALQGVTLAAVYASQYQRTQLTVKPAAEVRNMEVQVVDAGDTGALVEKIRQHAGSAVLVAGHSNTVPEIAKALGLSDAIALGEKDYGDLFVVKAKGSEASLEKQRFGA